jgi:hypothetical protein
MKTPLALAVTLSLACAVSRGPAEPAVPDPDLLTAAELGAASEASVYEAVRRLRPRFLQSRGPTSVSLPSAGPAVWVDGTLMGGVEWLSWLLPRDVVTIRRLSAWDAATMYGSRSTDGVIVVTTRP